MARMTEARLSWGRDGPPPPIRFVAFDMDGTLVDTRSSWATVHDHFQESNEDALRAFMADEIDDEEFVRQDLERWRRHKEDIALQDLERILARVPIMPGAHELFQTLRARGIRTAIISGGLDVLARRLAREYRIDVCFANGFETDPQGRLIRGRIEVPVKNKEGVLRRLQADLGFGPEETASVGNSEIDVGLFRASRIGIAFLPEDEQVRQAASFVVEERDLRCLLPLILGPSPDPGGVRPGPGPRRGALPRRREGGGFK
jgi:phosphoserine phosphatase